MVTILIEYGTLIAKPCLHNKCLSMLFICHSSAVTGASPCGPLYLVSTQFHSRWPAAHLALGAVPTKAVLYLYGSVVKVSSFSRRISWGALPWTSVVLSVGGLGCTKYSPGGALGGSRTMLKHYRFREPSKILCFQVPAEPELRLYDLSYLDDFLIIYREERVWTG